MENLSITKENLHSFLNTANKKGAAKNPLCREPLLLNIVFKKNPIKRQIIRFKLDHDLQPPTICVFTKDIYANDYEKSSNHYTDLAKSENVRKDVTFLPLRELTVCYLEYEAKRRLSNTFDLFLADQRIIHRLPNKLGKAFYAKKKCHPISVNLEADLSKEINKATSSTQLVIQARGSSESCIIGYEDLSVDKLYDNIICAMTSIPTKWPGGMANIRSVSIAYKKSNLPLYYSTTELTGVRLPRDSKCYDSFNADVKAVLKDLPDIHPEIENKNVKGKKLKQPIKKASMKKGTKDKVGKPKLMKKSGGGKVIKKLKLSSRNS